MLIFASAAYGQQQGLSFNFFGGGARSEGMGQAFIAVSDDGTAASWNPAGLHVQERTLMTFAYAFLLPRGEYTYYDTDGISVFDKFAHDGSINSLNYFNIASPIRIKNHHVVLSFGYTRNFDVYYKFGEVLFDEWAGEDPNSFYEREGGISNINFSLGTRIFNKLSFGISANIYNGRIITEENRFFEREGTHFLYGTATYTSHVRILDSAKYTGFNTTIGLLYKTEKFGAGLTIRTPFKLKGESDTTLITESARNGVSIDSDDWELPGFDNFVSRVIYVDNITSRMEMPMNIGFGLSYKVKDNWLVSSDLEYRGFSGNKIENLEFKLLKADGTEEEIFMDDLNVPNWSNVIQFRFGTEYMLNTKIGEIPLRAGFRNEAIPTGNIISVENRQGSGFDPNKIYYVFQYDDDNITGYSFSLGSGIHWSQVVLDFAYTYTTYDQTISTSDGLLHSGNDWKNHHMNLSFTGYF